VVQPGSAESGSRAGVLGAVAGTLALLALALADAWLVKWREPIVLTLGGTAMALVIVGVGCFAAGARRITLVAMALATLAAGLGVSEWLMRGMNKPAQVQTLSAPLIRPDSILGTMTRANATSREVRSPLRPGLPPEWDVVYRTENDGARVVPGRPADGPAIALFGDSFVFGEGIDEAHTIAAGLQARLPGARVYNYGVRGHGTAQDWLLLRRVLAARPDVRLCVETFILDDMRRTAAPYLLLASWAGHLPRVEADGDSVVYRGRAYDALSRLERLHVDALAVSRVYRRLFGRLNAKATPADWQLVASVAAAMRAACESPGSGRRFLFVLLPSGPEKSDVVPYQEAFDAWKRTLAQRAVAVLDLNVPFDSAVAAGGPRSRFFFSDTHPNAAYDELVAKWLAAAATGMLGSADR
jgi:hypothetical protein